MRFFKHMAAEPMAWLLFLVLATIGLGLAYIALSSLHI